MAACCDRFFASLWLATLLSPFSHSPASGERLPLQNFTVRDGLPSDNINCIVRDRAGFIWVCTTEGLAVYDGFVFRTFGTADGLPHRNVNTVVQTRDGVYWIGTDDGLVRFRPGARAAGEARFTTIRPPAPTHWVPDKVIANRVLSVLEDRSGRLWCGTAQAGLFVVETRGEAVEMRMVAPSLPIDTQVNALAEADHGIMWVGTQRGLLRRSSDGTGQWFGFREGLAAAPGIVQEEITSLLVSGSQVFVGTRFAGLHQIDSAARPGQRAVVRSWRSESVHSGDGVHSLTATSDGHLWYGGPGGARQVRLDAAPGIGLRTWGVRDGLGPNEVSAVAEDADANSWIGTDGSGLFRLRRGGFTTFTVDDGLAGDQVKDLFMAQGALHVVTANARGLFLNRREGRRFKAAKDPYYIDALGWGTGQIALYDRQGDWWFATWAGAVRSTAPSLEALPANPGRRYGTREGVWTDKAFKVFEDSHGDVWIGTWDMLHNISRWRRDSGRVERHKARTFPYSEGQGFGFVPETFAEAPAGTIWTGSVYGGVARFMNGRWDYFDEQDGAPAGRIQKMFRDSAGRLWIGSNSSGLARVDQPGADRPVFAPVRKADGLSSDLVLAITEDLKGYIYVGTGLGVDRLTPSASEVRRYGVEDGLPGGRVVAAFRDPQGDLWFGTSRGLSRFRPSAFADPSWPVLRLMSVTVPGTEVDLPVLGDTSVPDLRLESFQNAVQITVGALASGPMPGLRFEGRLEGAEAGWIPVEPGRPVMLLNLQPGAYRFVARAVTASGRSGPSSVSVAFTIRPPWWLRPWALGLDALALVGLLAAAYRLRVRQLLAIEGVRTRIASDLHDDIGSSLSRMAILSDIASGPASVHSDARTLGALGEIGVMARTLVDQMGDIVWSADPKDDSVAAVIGRAAWFGAELFELRGTTWRCTVADEIATSRLALEAKRHLLLLLKEALNNIAKHAGAREARLDARVDGHQLAIDIADDGRGFEAAQSRPPTQCGHGLQNMRDRAREMGGTCDVQSSPDTGCRILIRIPLPSHRRAPWIR